MPKKKTQRRSKKSGFNLKKFLAGLFTVSIISAVAINFLAPNNNNVLGTSSTSFGNVGSFSASNNTYVKTNAPSFTNYASNMAIQALVKFVPAGSSSYTIVSRDDITTTVNGFLLSLDSSGRVIFTFSTRDSVGVHTIGKLTGPVLSPNAWHFLSVVYKYDLNTSSGDVVMYVDGVEGGRVHEGVVAIAGGGSGRTIVGNNSSLSSPFNGYIDEMNLTNTSLVSNSITEPLYYDSDTSILMHFDESSGDPAAKGKVPVTTSANSLTYTASDYQPAMLTSVPIRYSVGGKVFIDSNRNKKKDLLEKYYPGVTIKLSGNAQKTTKTGSGGDYKFSSLVPGGYVVSAVAPSGYKFTTVNSVSLNLTKNTTLNFGLVKK